MSDRPADVLVRNAKVFTVDDARPAAGAVAIGAGSISWVGDDGEARAHAGPATIEIDAAGHTVMPGVIDSHDHVRLGQDPEAIDLHGVRTAAGGRDPLTPRAPAPPAPGGGSGGAA